MVGVEMIEKPILFSTEMVQAIQGLIKTMTRRLNGLKKINENPGQWEFVQLSFSVERRLEAIFKDKESNLKYIKCPWEVGQTLWVRETWCELYDLDDNDQIIDGTGKYYYAADNPKFKYTHFLRDDGTHKDYPAWKPSIFMPRKAARLFLKVKDIRVEKLQDITEEDAKKEGCIDFHDKIGNGKFDDVVEFDLTAKDAFGELWDGINSKRGYGWDINPWVWVVEFERVEAQEGSR